MHSLVLLFVLGVASSAGSIDARDPQSGEKQIDFINNGVVNAFAGLPVTTKSEPIDITDDNRYITLGYINISWLGQDGNLKWKEDLDERSKYGMGRVMEAEGRLAHVSNIHDLLDHTACNDSGLSDSFGRPLETLATPWIALIKRGGCDFEKKILHVYRRKASAVIIYNNVSGSELNYMKVTKKELLEGNITSVFTSLLKGLDMAEKIEDYENVIVSLRPGSRFDKKSGMNHRSSVLFVTISFIIVMVISMLWLVVYYYQRFRYLQTKENEQKMDTNKAKEALKKIPTKTIKTLSKVGVDEGERATFTKNKYFRFSRQQELESDCCAVCIEAYRINDVLRTLPCKYVVRRHANTRIPTQNPSSPSLQTRVP